MRNGFEPTNVGCQNTASQIQGDKNTVALSSQQIFPGAGASPCVAFEEAIPLITRGQASTIEELCEFLETLDPLGQEITLRAVSLILFVELHLDQPTVEDIIRCLRDALGMTTT